MALVSLGRALGLLAEQAPDRVAVRDDRGELTRRELDLESNRLARCYAQAGVVQDSLVQLSLPNSVEFYLACAAAWKLGATPQPVSAGLPVPERAALLELAEPALVVGEASGTAGRAALPRGFVAPRDVSDAPLPDRVPASWKAPTSGGSTGRPKIILSGSPGLVDPSVPAVPFLPVDGRQLVPGPLFHNGPFTYSMRGLLTGQTLVVLPRFDAETVLRSIEQERITWSLLVPTMMHRIWRLPDDVRLGYDLSSLQTVLHLGAPCPPWLKRAWIDWLGPERVLEVYAGTEAQGISVIDGREWLARPGSVGRAALGSRFRVLGPDGHDVPVGETGEVFMMPVGGPGSTYRYLGAQARAVDGWESLGDLGRLDEEGYLYLADRSPDVVLSGGANVYPAEVEAALDAHPAVRSSAVIGLPDADLGERVHAVVDVAGEAVTAEELQAHVASLLVRYKVPRSVELVHEPLRGDDGKVRRSALRADRLGAAGQGSGASSPPERKESRGPGSGA